MPAQELMVVERGPNTRLAKSLPWECRGLSPLSENMKTQRINDVTNRIKPGASRGLEDSIPTKKENVEYEAYN